MLSRIRAVYARRAILRLLVTRDLKVKYSDSTLGYLWSVLEPLSLVAVYWFVFTQIFTRSVGAEPYILFLVTGLLPWQAVQGVINESTRVLTRDKKLVRSTNLPRETWILRSVGTRMTELMFTVPVIVLFAIIYRNDIEVTAYIFAVPAAIIIQAILLTGIALVLAPLTVLFADLERLIRVISRLLFYASPVIYSTADVPDGLRELYAFNPVAGILEVYRAVFFPELFLGWGPTLISAGMSVAILLLGMFVFHGLERRVLKEI